MYQVSEESVMLAPEMSAHVKRIEANAQTVDKILNGAQRPMAIDNVREIRTKRDEIVAFFRPEKEARWAAHKAIVGYEKRFTDILDGAEKRIRQAIQAWDADEAERIRVERARLQALADEQARKERERLAREAAKLKTPELRAQRMEQAAAVVAPVVQVSMPEKQKGESTRMIWSAQVTDESVVPREYLIVNQKALDIIARSTKGAIKIPGVKMVETPSLAIGR